TPISANVAATGNLLVSPNGLAGPLSGGIATVGRGATGRFNAPAAPSYTAAGVDDGSIILPTNATGPGAGWASASLPVTLPTAASVGAGYTIAFISDNNKAVVINRSSSDVIKMGGQSLTSVNVGPDNFQVVVLKSDGANFRVEYASQGVMAINGAGSMF